nr:Wzy polymerase domain-containing protein [uncultured Deefgea sp.]
MSRTSYLSLLLLASAPFILQWGYAPSTSWASENIALLLALGFCLSAGLRLRNTETIKLPATAMALFGFALLSFISIPINKPTYISPALIACFYFITAAISSIIISNYSLSRTQISTALAIGICAGGLLQLPFALMEVFGQINRYNEWVSTLPMLIPRFADSNNASGFMQQRNLLGDYVFLSGLAACYLFSQKILNKSIFFIICISLSFCLALASSRSILLYIACTIIITLFFHIKKNKIHSITKPLFFFSILALLLQLAAPLLPFLNSDSALIRATQEAPLGVRWIEWQKAWQAFIANPISGLGVGGYANWSFEQNQSYPFNFNSSSPPLFTHSHNLILQILAEYGLLGAVILFAFSAQLINGIYNNKKDSESVFLIAAISIITIHSLVEFPLWHAQFFLIFIIFCTLLEETNFNKNISFAGRNLLFLAIPTLLLTLGIAALNWYGKLATSSFPTTNTSQMNDNLNELLQFSKNPVMSADSDHSLLWRLDLTDKDLDFKLELSKRLIHYRPYQNVAYKRAIYLSYNNQHKEAIELLEKLLKNSPKSIDTFLIDLVDIQDDKRLKPIKDFLINAKSQQTALK